jgi:hypothetical protein
MPDKTPPEEPAATGDGKAPSVAAQPAAASPPLEPLPATALRTETTQQAPPADDGELLFEFTEERRFQLYAERRKGYSEAARDAYTRFHQTLIGLSAGGVILSITFAKEIGRAPESIPWLVWGWFGILAGGAATFAALITSGEADRERIRQIDCLATTSKCDETRANRLGTITVVLNWIATFLCLLGIALLVKFATINISKPGGDHWRQEKAVPANQAAPSSTAAPPPRKAPSPPPLAQPSAATAAPAASSTKPIPVTQSQRP